MNLKSFGIIPLCRQYKHLIGIDAVEKLNCPMLLVKMDGKTKHRQVNIVRLK